MRGPRVGSRMFRSIVSTEIEFSDIGYRTVGWSHSKRVRKWETLTQSSAWRKTERFFLNQEIRNPLIPEILNLEARKPRPPQKFLDSWFPDFPCVLL